jgi:hypothetical protein
VIAALLPGPFNHGRFGSHWDADPWLFVAGTFVVLVAVIVWAIRVRRRDG